jgi:hypothetical protein
MDYIDSIDVLNAFTCISLYDLSVMCFNALLFSPLAHGTSIPMIYLRYPSSPEVLNTFRTRAISAAMAAAGQGNMGNLQILQPIWR